MNTAENFLVILVLWLRLINNSWCEWRVTIKAIMRVQHGSLIVYIHHKSKPNTCTCHLAFSEYMANNTVKTILNSLLVSRWDACIARYWCEVSECWLHATRSTHCPVTTWTPINKGWSLTSWYCRQTSDGLVRPAWQCGILCPHFAVNISSECTSSSARAFHCAFWLTQTEWQIMCVTFISFLFIHPSVY